MVILISGFVLTVPSLAASCQKTFDGADFLRASYKRGYKPKATNCHLVNLDRNAFYALPDKDCLVDFHLSEWLTDGWIFSSLEGYGEFTKTLQSGHLLLNISKARGFMLHSISLETSMEDCEAATVDDVLR